MLQEWNNVWRTSRPVLQVHDQGTRLHVFDTRGISGEQTWNTGKLEAEVYRACDSARAPAAVKKVLSDRLAVSRDEIQSAIDTLCEAKVVLPINDKLLSIGVAA